MVINMNFEQMRLAYRKFDEVMPIGRMVEWEGKAYHIAGMTRSGKQAEMYVLESMPEEAGLPENGTAESGLEEVSGKEGRKGRHTNRMSMKIVPVECPLFNIRTIRLGDQELETGGANSGPLALNEGCAVEADNENDFLFMK